jgi:ATP-dependent RNA helicase DeaD
MITFADLGLQEDIIKALSALGFTEPTPVQAKVIPLMLERQVDMVSLAQTGTGKTGAFGLPLIQLIDTTGKKTQGLILCPTRELCIQVSLDLESYARYVPGLRILAVYGGTSIEPQIKALGRGIHIIVATPGRLNDLIRRGRVDFSAVRYAVFDEADEMLNMGFQEELNAILAKTPKEKNTLLFSATMSKEVQAISKNYMTDPVEITVGKRNAGAENVNHEFYMVQAKDRYLALKRIVDNNPNIYSIIFCRTRKDTQEVADKLIQDGYNADALHGELSQAQRDQVMNKFRAKNLQILVATDVAARGLDVNDLTHVINYNLPDDIAYYTHRSGRTGRAGRTGTSVAIIHMKEQFKIREIEKRINKKFKQCRIPSGVEICKKQLVRLVDEVSKVAVDHDQLEPLFATISKKLADLDRDELIKRFVSLEFNRFLAYYKNAPDLNVGSGAKTLPARTERPRREPARTERPRREPTGTERPRRDPATRAPQRQKFARFALNVGRRQGIAPQGIIGKINGIQGCNRIDVGKIEVMRNRVMLEADSRYALQILEAFKDFIVEGKAVGIEILQDNQPPSRPKQERGILRKPRKP